MRRIRRRGCSCVGLDWRDSLVLLQKVNQLEGIGVEFVEEDGRVLVFREESGMFCSGKSRVEETPGKRVMLA